MKGYIPEKLYKKILGCMPVFCVDLVVRHYSNYKGQYGVMLFKRTYEPSKNEWFVAGGRVLWGEKMEKAVHRKALEEIGMKVKIIKRIGTYEPIFDKNKQGTRGGTHNITVGFLVEPIGKINLSLNKEYSDWKVIWKPDNKLPKYVKDLIKDSEVFK